MQNRALLVVAILLAAVAAVWCSIQCEKSHSQARSANHELVRCQQLSEGIQTLRSNNAAAISVGAASYDPSINVTKAAQEAGISTDDFSVRHFPGKQIEDSDVREWTVDLPVLSATLSESIQFIRQLDQAPIRFHTNSITMTRDPESEPPAEKWKAEFSIGYLGR